MVNLYVLVIYQISYSLPMLVKGRKLDVIFKLVFVSLNRNISVSGIQLWSWDIEHIHNMWKAKASFNVVNNLVFECMEVQL